MKILVTGSIAYDLLLKYEGSFPESIDPAHLSELSMAFTTEHFAKHHGGCGANIAWNLMLLGRDPLLVGTVGMDGGAYTALLEEKGIDTKHIDVKQGKATSTAIVATDSAEHQITFYHPGADSIGTFPDLAEDRDDLSYGIISPRAAKLMMEGVDWCSKFSVPYLFDPGQQIMTLTEEELLRAIEHSKGVVANAYEWSLLSKRTSFSTDQILEHTPMLIITQGEEGVVIYTQKETVTLPACKTDTLVNPTGAGDAFRAGLLAGLSAKWPVPQSAKLGMALASFVVEQEGTLLDLLDMDELSARAEIAYGEKLPALPKSSTKKE